MGKKKQIVRLGDLLIEGWLAVIICAAFIPLIDIAIWNMLPQDSLIGLEHLEKIFAAIITFLGVLSPVISRAYADIKAVHITAAIFAVLSLIFPYLMIPFHIGGQYINLQLGFIMSVAFISLPLTLLYLISLLFAFGEALHIEAQGEILKKWKWRLSDPFTYCLIPYYFVLACNALLIMA